MEGSLLLNKPLTGNEGPEPPLHGRAPAAGACCVLRVTWNVFDVSEE